MYSEERLRYLIEQCNLTIKSLIKQVREIRMKKRKYQAALRDLRWESKQAGKKRVA